MVRIPRGWAWFLVAVGVWSWVIWPRFALAIWDDPRAWSTRNVGHGSPTGFLWIHAALIAVSLAMGTAVGVLGVRALLHARRGRRSGAYRDTRPVGGQAGGTEIGSVPRGLAEGVSGAGQPPLTGHG